MAHRASVGIISIGEMGLGVAKLLISQNYRVLTNITGRSQHTQDRAKGASVQLVSSDADLVHQSDYIVSIVPPKDALATADRIVSAQSSKPRPSDASPLYYLDLNAVAPSSALAIAARFKDLSSAIRFVDGGIIGGPPKAPADGGDASDAAAWTRPSIVLSGKFPLVEAPKDGKHMAELLNTKHVGDDIGVASGLKCCYATLTKGFTALAIQSYTTAARLGVLEELRTEIRATNPANEKRANGGLVGMAPKSGRWVAEMHEIAKTHRETGGWADAGEKEGGASGIFDGAAEVYRYVAEDTVLGKEHSLKRTRGTTAEDVVAAINESRK
ncbi:6-phosphogluconate dehydrogenase C-terminal domain-like protein [Microthyrium microscopicum]|uniref:6-phosphogluconate dehydrogenase C-terminal domain-like protein n=1 Tax=Microthyrium microscopicum TaxID=703497 RepID=A0A6A6UN90_9PEZI|nr:6-phosphogluconate dehydrogenase C-terminal domain-like protein [Microthyrium microscopicum]